MARVPPNSLARVPLPAAPVAAAARVALRATRDLLRGDPIPEQTAEHGDQPIGIVEGGDREPDSFECRRHGRAG